VKTVSPPIKLYDRTIIGSGTLKDICRIKRFHRAPALRRLQKEHNCFYYRTIVIRHDASPPLAADIRRGVTRLSRRLRAERSADALSANKLCVLSHLYPNKQCSPGEISSAEHLQPQSLSKLLAELESEGLTVRSKSPADGRQFVLKITQKGRRALQHDMSERDLWLASALQHLSETEVQLLHITARIMERLADFDVNSSQAQESQPAISQTI